jgi:hypothetical protein
VYVCVHNFLSYQLVTHVNLRAIVDKVVIYSAKGSKQKAKARQNGLSWDTEIQMLNHRHKASTIV